MYVCNRFPLAQARKVGGIANVQSLYLSKQALYLPSGLNIALRVQQVSPRMLDYDEELWLTCPQWPNQARCVIEMGINTVLPPVQMCYGDGY